MNTHHWMDKETWMPIRTEYYNVKGELVKNSDIKKSIVPVEKSSSTSVGTVSKPVKRNLEYSLNLTYSKSMMKFLIINNTSKDIELIFSNTHTFDFILSKNGNVVYDNYKDNPNVSKLVWETHQILKANGYINFIGQGYDIWYENLTKKVNDGIYNFEFYSTSEMLKDVPHFKGQLEIKDGDVNVNSIRLN